MEETFYVIYSNSEGTDIYFVDGKDYLAKINDLVASHEDDQYDAYLLVTYDGSPIHVERIYADIDVMEE